MKTNRITIIIPVLLLFICKTSFAQIYYTDSDSVKNHSLSFFDNNISLSEGKRFGFAMEMGMGMYGSKYSSGAYSYISPFLSYKATSRLRLDFGARYFQGFGNFLTNENDGFGYNPSGLSVFVRGNYLLTDRLLVSGTVYKTFDLGPNNLSQDFYGNQRNFDNYGFILGLDYKISEKSVIGIQIDFSSGVGPANNPFFYQDRHLNGIRPDLYPYEHFGQSRYFTGFGN